MGIFQQSGPLILTPSGGTNDWKTICREMERQYQTLGRYDICLRGGDFPIANHVVTDRPGTLWSNDGSRLVGYQQIGRVGTEVSQSLLITGSTPGVKFSADLATGMALIVGDNTPPLFRKMRVLAAGTDILPAPLDSTAGYIVTDFTTDGTEKFSLANSDDGSPVVLTGSGTGSNFILGSNFFVSAGVNTGTGELTFKNDLELDDGDIVIVRGWPTATSGPTGISVGVNSFVYYSFEKTDTNKGILHNTANGSAIIPSDQGLSTQIWVVERVSRQQSVRGLGFFNSGPGINVGVSVRQSIGTEIDDVEIEIGDTGAISMGVRGTAGSVMNSQFTRAGNAPTVDFSNGQATNGWILKYCTFLGESGVDISLNSITHTNIVESNTLTDDPDSGTIQDLSTTGPGGVSGNLIGTNFGPA
jgi:hypothetical protein